MFSIALALALTPSASPAEARSAWESCLLSYAQIESLGSKTDVAITLRALDVCSAERGEYTKFLIRTFSRDPAAGDTAVALARKQVSLDQRALSKQVLAFIRVVRQS